MYFNLHPLKNFKKKLEKFRVERKEKNEKYNHDYEKLMIISFFYKKILKNHYFYREL